MMTWFVWKNGGASFFFFFVFILELKKSFLFSGWLDDCVDR